jgi:hypothetical protein
MRAALRARLAEMRKSELHRFQGGDPLSLMAQGKRKQKMLNVSVAIKFGLELAFGPYLRRFGLVRRKQLKSRRQNQLLPEALPDSYPS